MFNIINVKISDYPLTSISISFDSKFVIVRSSDNSCFYLFSLKELVLFNLINCVFDSEYQPQKINEVFTEEYFMQQINSVVNRYTIQNNIFTDVKFVPNRENLV